MHGIEHAPQHLVGPRLRAVRLKLQLSQQAFADTIRAVGLDIDEPNRCTKRLVQKWEAGVHGMPVAPYRHAIEKLTGEAFSFLCAPTPPKDTADAARRVSLAIAKATSLQAELLDLHAFLTCDTKPEVDHGSRH